MEFRRIHDLPPYVFATVDQLKRELRRDGRDVIDLGFGNPDIPSPPIAVEKLAEAATKAGRTTATRRAAGCRTCARRSASATRSVFGVRLDPDEHVVCTIGAKEGLAHLMWVLLERRRQRGRPEPELPDPSRRAAPRRRDRRPRPLRATATCSAGIEEAVRRRRSRRRGW